MFQWVVILFEVVGVVMKVVEIFYIVSTCFKTSCNLKLNSLIFLSS